VEDFEQAIEDFHIPKPKATLAKQDHIALSNAESSTVSRLPNSPTYNVVLRILEGEIEKLETEHMQAWRDKELFERTGLVAVSARMLYEKFQIEVNYHSAEFVGAMDAAANEQAIAEMTPEDFIRQGFGIE
jgi:hypothetical protein